MRPVLLEMHGFASFRERTAVDFTDADYFALVGPTGSGKSTVMDAMTFALYGSAPRWGRRNAVSFALAPTTTRGTVRLVFDAGPHRYVVAREVRRTGSAIGMKGSRFERLADPAGVGAEGEATESVATDGEVSAAVADLLGLTFEQFCQCVVLPQGEFAEFLRSAPADRQKILLKLLGAERYEEIARRANQRAGLAEQRAAVLADQLAELADATDGAERQARDTQEDLERLAAHVEERLPALAAAARARSEALAEHDRLAGQQATLADVAVPAHVGQLDARQRAAQAAMEQAARDEAEAQERDTRARQALDAAPPRAPLEAARARHAERAGTAAQLPAATRARDEAVAAVTAAGTRVAAGEAALEAARARQQAARGVAELARSQVEQVTRERALLAGLAVPDGVAGLADLVTRARAAAAAARADLDRAEEADTAAQGLLGRAPDRTALVRRRDLLRDLADRQAGIPALTAAREHAAAAARDADTTVATSSEAVAAAEAAWNAARHADLAAALRPHLEVGRPCPVCDRTVDTLPGRLGTPRVAAAEEHLREAREGLAAARERQLAAQGRQATAAAALEGAVQEIDRLRAAATAARPGASELSSVELVTRELASVDAALSTLDELAGRAGGTRAALETARRHARDATTTLADLTATEGEARAALLAARDPLVPLGAPAVDDADLLAAWTGLAGWARTEDTHRAGRLAAARAGLAEAEAAFEQARAAFEAAGTGLARERAAEQRAVQAAEQARARAEALTGRLTELADLLRDAPADAEAEALLAEAARLEAEQRQAGAAVLAARAVHEQARRQVADLDARIAAGFAELRKARDPFVALGVPELPDGGLLDAWTALARWAGERSAALLAALPGVTARVEAARRDEDDLGSRLASEIARHGLDVPPGALAARASPAVAAAVERARASTDRVRERRLRAVRLAGERADAEGEQQVAKLLGDLLRADRFQRWLATTALDALVVDASASLTELSGGQFDLTHDKGEFFVIDHADADSRRSVRTLSGGETFQASLALALALSAHMSTLAAAGATRLDSIFLDEGFGTLDPDTLEVVATTLEGLAQGERMVGVITHVAALADRVPVRFRVRRDATTSSVVRETA